MYLWLVVYCDDVNQALSSMVRLKIAQGTKGYHKEEHNNVFSLPFFLDRGDKDQEDTKPGLFGNQCA